MLTKRLEVFFPETSRLRNVKVGQKIGDMSQDAVAILRGM
jgi:hypothetical protein